MHFYEDDDDDQDYVLKSVSCDIKKVQFPAVPLTIQKIKLISRTNFMTG